MLPPNIPEYHALFRCPVVFNAEAAGLLFDRAHWTFSGPSRTISCEWLETSWNAYCAPRTAGPLHVRIRAILERDANFVPAAHTFRAVSQDWASRRVPCAAGYARKA